MILLFSRQRLSYPFRIGGGFPLRYIHRPVQRKRNLFKHASPEQFAVSFDPKVRTLRPLLHESQILAVGYFVLLHSKTRRVDAVLVIFVVPAEGAVMPLPQQRLPFRYFAPAVLMCTAFAALDHAERPLELTSPRIRSVPHIGQSFQMHQSVLKRHLDDVLRRGIKRLVDSSPRLRHISPLERVTASPGECRSADFGIRVDSRLEQVIKRLLL